MKRIICLFVTMILLVTLLPINTSANEMESRIIYFADGSFLEVIMETVELRTSGTISGGKTYQYKNSNGELQWKAVLNGMFTYTGSSATCTSSSCNVTIYNTSWYQVTKTTGKRGATATAELTMGYKVLGITAKKVPISMTLTCDKDGNLS